MGLKSIENSLIDLAPESGFRRGSSRIYDQRMETSHLRKHGIWRGTPHGAHDGRLGVLGRNGQLNVLESTHRYLCFTRVKGGRCVVALTWCMAKMYEFRDADSCLADFLGAFHPKRRREGRAHHS